MTVPTYRIPRESGLEGIGPFSSTVGGVPDTTIQLTIHPYGIRPTEALWYDPETIQTVANCVGVGTGSTHWSALSVLPGKYRVSLRDKQTPSYERIGVAILYIT